MEKIKFIFAICWAIPGAAFAGGAMGGNGGNAVVCFDSVGKIKSAEVLDVFEARTLRGIPLRLFPPSNTINANLAILYTRLAIHSPHRASRYRTFLNGFYQNANFMAGIDLVEIDDSDHLVLPVNCKRVQLIIQQEPKFPEDKRFLVNKDVWDHLDIRNRSVVMLHEAFLHEMLANRTKLCQIGASCTWEIETSEMRYLVSKLFSGQSDSQTTQQFHDIQRQIPYLFNFESKEFDVELKAIPTVLESRIQPGFGGIGYQWSPVNPILSYDSLGRIHEFVVSPSDCDGLEILFNSNATDFTQIQGCTFRSIPLVDKCRNSNAICYFHTEFLMATPDYETKTLAISTMYPFKVKQSVSALNFSDFTNFKAGSRDFGGNPHFFKTAL